MSSPVAPVKKKLDSARAWAETRQLLREHRTSLAIGLALMVVNRIAGLVLPWTSKFLIDDVIGKGRAQLLMPLAGAAGLATLIQAATGFANSQVVSIAAQRAITEMRKRVQEHVMRLPVAYFDSTKTGILISRVMSDAEGVRNIVGTGLIQLVGSLITAVLALGILFWLNWKLTAITIVVLAAFGGMMAIAFKRLRPLFRERSVTNADVTGRLAESLGGVRLVKVYVAERRERLVFARGVHKLFRNVASTITGTSAVGSGAAVIVGLIGVLMIIVGGRAIIAHTMTLGGFIMYVFFVGLMAAPLVQMASIGTQISEAFAGLDRIREIMQTPTEDQADAGKASLEELRGEVKFEDVTFEYVPGVPVLKHISFDAEAGSTTALVGPSGGGKSTLINLVMAFTHPKSGRVLVDGHDLENARLHDYRAQLGAVMQDNFLFDGTIRENIAYSKPGATIEEVRTVARIAHVDEFAEKFELQYETVVGERGVKLSGGQRQRIAIARAILADPRILILDEATSSLDSESEALIQEGLKYLMRGRTTFVIAHRLSTIRRADQILVVEAGRIIERGTHETLYALGGRYYDLYTKQHAVETNLFLAPGESTTPEEPAESSATGNGRGAAAVPDAIRILRGQSS